MLIDIEKLKSVKRSGDGSIVAQCPYCAAMGRDLVGKNHLSILPSGKFSCIVFPGDKQHNKGILSLAGLGETSEYDLVFNDEFEAQKIKIEKFYDESTLDGLVKDYEFYESRGISRSILEELRCGVALRGYLANRIVFPIFNKKGKIHGFSGRSLIGASMKWKHFAPKSNWVYPAFFVDREIKQNRRVILVESIGDMLALMNAGIRTVLVLFGVNLHSGPLSYLIETNPDNIIISTNKDVKHLVGQHAAEKIEHKLLNYFDKDKIKIKFPPKKDWGECDANEIKEFWKNAW